MPTLDHENYRGYGIYVEQEMDWEAFNPRKNNDNLGTMVCFHKEYPLGDEHDFNSPDELVDYINQEEEVALYLPLFLMDHGNITMRTKGFGDVDPHGWDWGQVGYIYVTHEDLEREYGIVSHDAICKADQVLRAEVNEYGNFIAGEVFYVTVFDPENELVDSISGIIGTDQLDEAKKEAEAVVDNIIEREVYELLPEDKYVARKRCPNCKRPLHEVAVKLYGIQTFSPVLKARESHTPPYESVTQRVGCSKCRYEWVEYYELTLIGYEELIKP